MNKSINRVGVFLVSVLLIGGLVHCKPYHFQPYDPVECKNLDSVNWNNEEYKGEELLNNLCKEYSSKSGKEPILEEGLNIFFKEDEGECNAVANKHYSEAKLEKIYACRIGIDERIGDKDIKAGVYIYHYKKRYQRECLLKHEITHVLFTSNGISENFYNNGETRHHNLMKSYGFGHTVCDISDS